MHIICSVIEPSGVTLACDDIQNNFEADLHNSQETIVVNPSPENDLLSFISAEEHAVVVFY